MPAVVTIQAPAGSFGDLDGLAPEDIELPDDVELPEGFEIPEGLGDLQELLPEGFGLPQEFGFGGTGSGVIVDARKGYVLTNHHVAGEAERITVVTGGDRRRSAKVVGTDSERYCKYQCQHDKYACSYPHFYNFSAL